MLIVVLAIAGMLKAALKMIERVYHPVCDWEEVKHGMYDSVDNKKAWLKKAIAFTGDHILYGRFMMRVINEWPISCENALTDMSINRKAWIGHAAAALGIGCPEDIVREAWGLLTDEQRILANNQAQRAIDEWEFNYRESKGIYQQVAEKML